MLKKFFCYSDEIINFPKKFKNKILLINPLLRKEFYSMKSNYNNEINDEIRLLIIGGSQGAQLFDNELKKAIIFISKKYKLNIYQQTSPSNVKNLGKFL